MRPEQSPWERVLELGWSLVSSESLTNILIGVLIGNVATNLDVGWIYVRIRNVPDLALIATALLVAIVLYGWSQWLQMKAEQARREYLEPQSDIGIE